MFCEFGSLEVNGSGLEGKSSNILNHGHCGEWCSMKKASAEHNWPSQVSVQR
jgi:hypothetical protein